ncbi:glycosyltransferase [Hymenobacter jejuensis]|uniref:Glycosyltransferase family 2 protein n=1 Tax=Hymenobacter jejuensis TaxID=2502781 RepID=A0A5B7ZYW0_9BACT|nr:glycosyltransferase family A protein [Hymenobacter jejuensis]QDA59615.1 glycosyltransferase family 2 protein [Hymenobacter jejuensis]
MEPVLPLRFQGGGEPMASAPRLYIGAPPASQLLATVIIPAKNEARHLKRALMALAAQTDLDGAPFDRRSYEIIVLANNCRDQTAEVARRFARTNPDVALHVVELTLPPAEAHVGRARRLLMDEAYRRLELHKLPNCFIASTDADTCVAPTWLAATHAELAAGADAVGGRILTIAGTCRASVASRRHHLRDAVYRLLRARLESLIDPDPADAWPRHQQHFGASFAITPQAYRQVGGLPVVQYLEDEALYQALRRHDLRVRHSPLVRVLTSDRQTGRVAVGLSWQLRQWSRLHQQQREPQVESGKCLLQEWQTRRQLRSLWATVRTAAVAPHRQTVRELSTSLGISAIKLALQLPQAATFGALWSWVAAERATAGLWEKRWPLVPLQQALDEVRQLIRHYERPVR